MIENLPGYISIIFILEIKFVSSSGLALRYLDVTHLIKAEL